MKTTIRLFFVLILTAFIFTVAAAESVTVSDLHAKRTELVGKQITITGKVTKVNNGIMHRNFLHVKDGTGSGKTGQAVFTSQQTAEVGDNIAVTGIVKIDIDFGMGYFYPTLIEEATIKPVK